MIVFLSILLGTSILGMIIGVVSYVYYDVNKQKSVKKNIRTEEELMSIVFSVLERKWAYRVQFHFKIKDRAHTVKAAVWKGSVRAASGNACI